MISRNFTACIKRVQQEDVEIPVCVTLSYDAETNPFAVKAVFTVPGGGEEVVWNFSRDLLAVGSRSFTPYGQGDIRFRLAPYRRIVIVCMRVQGRGADEFTHADVVLPQDEVDRFLADTDTAAQVTDEECDALVDVFLKELFEA